MKIFNCYDNAVCESFFKTLKTELIYQKAGGYKSKEDAMPEGRFLST